MGLRRLAGSRSILRSIVAFFIVDHVSRRVVHIGVTRHPTTPGSRGCDEKRRHPARSPASYYRATTTTRMGCVRFQNQRLSVDSRSGILLLLSRCIEEETMACPYCQGNATQEVERTTALGYRLFRCRPCRRTFNERTSTPFNHLQVPTDIALLVVLWRLRYKLSLRDLAEMFLTRGFTFTHETVRDWEERFAPLLTERLRAKRRGKAGKKWHADETYVKVDGRWCYLYRAIDADGNLVDSMLSETRDHRRRQAVLPAGAHHHRPRAGEGDDGRA